MRWTHRPTITAVVATFLTSKLIENTVRARFVCTSDFSGAQLGSYQQTTTITPTATVYECIRGTLVRGVRKAADVIMFRRCCLLIFFLSLHFLDFAILCVVVC